VLDAGLYYVSAVEPLISAMETLTLSARNVADLLLRDAFGTGICGKESNNDLAHDGTATKAASQTKASSEGPESWWRSLLGRFEAKAYEDEFVLGYDC
jgi:hypothetical protein